MQSAVGMIDWLIQKRLSDWHQLQSGPLQDATQPQAVEACSQGFIDKGVGTLNHHVQEELPPSKRLEKGPKDHAGAVTTKWSECALRVWHDKDAQTLLWEY